MTLLGQFSLWVALMLGVWASVIAFSGRWQDRPDLAASVTNRAWVARVTVRASSGRRRQRPLNDSTAHHDPTSSASHSENSPSNVMPAQACLS